MIKLVATDIDGTLVKESSPNITDIQVELFRKLVDQGICVAAASGRQYGSVSKVFAPVDRKLYYIVENGAHILYGTETLHKVVMQRSHVEGIMTDLRAYYDQGCHVVASTTQGCYLESKDEGFIRLMREGYRNDATLTDDILSLDQDFLKLAVYRKGSIQEIGENTLIPKWKDQVKATMAGAEWVDFMDASVDKGNGLKILMEHLSIDPSEVMAFGDNDNDIGLMRVAGESYAVANATPGVIEAAAHTCPPYWEDGVSQVLRTLI